MYIGSLLKDARLGFTAFTWYNLHPDRELSHIYYTADDTCKVLINSLKLVG